MLVPFIVCLFSCHLVCVRVCACMCACVCVCESWRVEQCAASEVRQGEEKIVNRDDDNPASKASRQLLITRKQTMD